MAELMMKKSKFQPKMDGLMLAQGNGGSWWGSWIAACIDSAIDLSLEIITDTEAWTSNAITSATNGLKKVVDDVEGILGEAVDDIGGWADHLVDGDFMEVVHDIGGWVGELNRDVNNWVLDGASGTYNIACDVADDVVDWIDDLTSDAERIANGTYCFEDDDPTCSEQPEGADELN